MSDTKDTGGNSGGRKPLTVSRKTSGTVKQSFSHGRSKQVVVETKKRRTMGPGAGDAPAAAPAAGASAEATREAKLKAMAAQRGITVAELVSQLKALKEREVQEAARAKEVERDKAAQDRLRTEQERKLQEQKEREEAEARRKAEEEARKAQEAVAKERTDRGAKARPKADFAATPAGAGPEAEDASGRSKRGGKSSKDDRNDRSRNNDAQQNRGGGRDGERRRGKLTIASALGDDADRQRSLASVKRARERERERRMGGGSDREKVSVEVTLPETITLQDLAGRMNERVADVVK
ncbi:MAG: translation initiation factor IF-2 associated domain-containing protein, partial [Hyphomonas sp.]|nr:translation initiation factor IF-2 associated domain-containing protein [Hyphomonas sp.]